MQIRFSSALMNQLTTSYLSKISEDIYNAETTALTGLSVTKPSDAPEKMQTIDAVEAALADQEVYGDNINAAYSLLSTADEALDTADDLLKRGQELALQFASETADGASRQTAAAEVDALRESLLAIANTEFSGQYVFAGTAYDAEPFDDAGNYLGNGDLPEVIVAEGRTVQTGFDGASVFQGGVDTFQLLEDLSAAMTANDPDAIADLLDDFETAIAEINTNRQRAGDLWVDTEDAEIASGSLSVRLAERMDSLVGADPVEAYVELETLQTSYEAALAVTAQTKGRSLFDYLR